MKRTIKIEWVLSRFRFLNGVLPFKSTQQFAFNVITTLGGFPIGNRIITLLNKIEQRGVFGGKIVMDAGRNLDYTQFYYKSPTCMNIVRE